MSASSNTRSIQIEASATNYDILIGSGVFPVILKIIADSHIIADEFFLHQIPLSPGHRIFLPATEAHKSLENIPRTIEQLRATGADRSTHLYAVGGGVLQDICAFVASTYMRGIHWSYVPTTVLAMVDSCIGGKSSINVGPYKNLIGTFHPPENIYIDPSLALTLPPDQFASGLIEAAKICFCRSPESFAAYLTHAPSTTMSTNSLEGVILESLHAKKHFIEIDEFDKKDRLLLNFGHTFGHALEGASHFGIPHGIAVGLGILCSLAFQRARGVDYSGTPIVQELTRHLDAMVRTLPTLRIQLAAVDPDDVLDRFGSDKKHTSQRFTLILVASNGQVTLEQVDRNPQTQQAIRRAIELTIESYAQ